MSDIDIIHEDLDRMIIDARKDDDFIARAVFDEETIELNILGNSGHPKLEHWMKRFADYGKSVGYPVSIMHFNPDVIKSAERVGYKIKKPTRILMFGVVLEAVSNE